jgi:PIN domain nuclease of toxin-antitoxin system
MRLLLDTCTLLWIARADPALAPSARALLSAPGADVVVSAVSAWEIAIKHARGRLPLPVPLPAFIASLRQRYGFRSLAIDEESVLHTAKLPSIHADPFDRLLVSQAIVHGLAIVTSDPVITQYPARTLW